MKNGGESIGGLADAALMAGRAEVATFAGEGEEAMTGGVPCIPTGTCMLGE